MGFWQGFEKVGSPRWIKELQKLKHVPQQMEDKLKSLNLPMREVRHLGRGGSQVADEMFHPIHGVAVRKVPVAGNPKDVERLKAHTKDIIAFWHDAKKITGGQGPFAHIKGHEGHVGFYEKAHASLKDRGPRLDRLVPKAYHHEIKAKYRDARQQRSERYMALKREAKKEVEFTGSDKAHLDKVKEKYPKLHDIRHANIVGGKIVDAEPSRTMRFSTHDSENFKNPVAHAKKTFSADTRKAQTDRNATNTMRS